MNANEVVQKLWELCILLKDDGVAYHEYATELTRLLFLKMAQEAGQEQRLPEGCRWQNLRGKEGRKLLQDYQAMLVGLSSARDALVRDIYVDAHSSIRDPKHLSSLVEGIEGIAWHDKHRERLGDIYEGLLQKNAMETFTGAGQYFTPRPLIESIVHLMQPKGNETILDPAAGTGGFLVSAFGHIRSEMHNVSGSEHEVVAKERLYGVELVPTVQRLGLMNCLLHGLEGAIQFGDSLGVTGERLPKADLILGNPAFGTNRGDPSMHAAIIYRPPNRQFAFLQLIYKSLKPGGRAAVVLPDNVLFEDGVGRQIREDLMNKCNLHTILRLPMGIFYARGVKTNVLFFTRGEKDRDNTKNVWVYDLRENMPSFGKRTPLTREHFAEFEKAFGPDPLGQSRRKDEGESGRFRYFSREAIREREDNLDISWSRSAGQEELDRLTAPALLVREVMAELDQASGELRRMLAELGGGGEP